MARPDDPVHLKNFDPKTFYPAIAVREDSVDTSIYPSSSISQTQAQGHHARTHLPRPELRHTYVLLYHAEQSPLSTWSHDVLTFGTASLGCGNSTNATACGYG